MLFYALLYLTGYGLPLDELKNFLFQAEDDIRHRNVTGVQTCALPILPSPAMPARGSTIRSHEAPPSMPPGTQPGLRPPVAAGWSGQECPPQQESLPVASPSARP